MRGIRTHPHARGQTATVLHIIIIFDHPPPPLPCVESDCERTGRRFAKAKLAKLARSDNVAHIENHPTIRGSLATIVALDAAHRD